MSEAKTVTVEELLVEIKLRADAFEKGMEDVEHRLAQSEAKAERTANKLSHMGEKGEKAGSDTKRGADEANKGLDENAAKSGETAAAYGALSAASVAAFVKIVSAVQSGIEKANEYYAAINGLRNQAEGLGIAFSEAVSGMEELTADALIGEGDVAAAIKNLLNYGFTLDQASGAIKRLKDSAAYGRQATYSLGEAVRVTTEGIRMENSVLSDAAGVQKNIAKMIEDYAKAQGKNKDALTQAEKAQAVYNGIMEETEIVVGNAAAYSEEFAGAQARLAKASLEVEQSIGGVAANALEPFLNILTPIVQGIADFVRDHEALVAGVGAFALVALGGVGAISAIVAAYKLWTAATTTLVASHVSLTAVAPWLAIGATIVGVVAMITTSIGNAKSELDRLSESVDNVASYQREAAALKANLAVLKNATSTTDELAAAKKALAEQYPALISHFDEEGKAVLKSNDAIQAKIDKTEELIERERTLILLTGNRVYDNATRDIEEHTAMRDRMIEAIAAEEEELAILDKAWRDFQETGEAKGVDGRSFMFAEIEHGIVEAERKIRDYEQTVIECDEAIAASGQALSGVLQVRYQTEIDALGKLSEVQMLVAEQARAEAIEQQLTQEAFSELLNQRVNDAELIAQAARDLADGANLKLKESFSEMGEAATGAQTDVRKITGEFERLGNMKGAVQVMESFAKNAKTGQKETKEYSDAVKYLAEQFGVSEEAIKKNLPAYKNEIALKEAMTKADYAKASSAAYAAKAETEAMVAAGTITRQQADLIIAALDDVIDKYIEWVGVWGKGGIVPTLDFNLNTSSGGGGSSASEERKAAWERELEMMERVKREMQALGDVYILVLRDVLAEQTLSAEERARLEKELAMAQKASAGDMEQDYIDYLRSILREQRLSAQQRLEIESQLVSALKAQYDGQITALNDLGDAVMQALRNKYQAEMEAQSAAYDDQLASLQESNRAQQEATNRARDERVAALEQGRDAKIKFIEAERDAALTAIEAERDARVDALEEQIRALDDLKKARDRANKDEDDQKQMERLQRQLAFEKDVRNRQILQEQIVQLEKDIADRKEDERIADEKQRLQDELKTVKQTAADRTKEIRNSAAEQLAITRETAKTMIEEARETARRQLANLQESLRQEQDNLRARQQANNDYWKRRLSDEVIMGEALVLLQDKTQDEIMQLLQTYYPEYLTKGQQMGQMLYSGFDVKYKALLERTRQVANDIVSQAERAIAAWRSMQSEVGSAPSGGGSPGGSSMWDVTPYSASLDGLFTRPLGAAIDAALYRAIEPALTVYADNPAVFGSQEPARGAPIAGRTGRNTLAGRPVSLTFQFMEGDQTAYEKAKAAERMLRGYFGS